MTDDLAVLAPYMVAGLSIAVVLGIFGEVWASVTVYFATHFIVVGAYVLFGRRCPSKANGGAGE